MAEIRVAADTADAGRDRERRIHEDDGRSRVRQMVGDGLRVAAGNVRIGKEGGEQLSGAPGRARSEAGRRRRGHRARTRP